MKPKKEQKISEKLLELGDIAKKISTKRKSVRTTIRITKEGHAAINRIAEFNFIKNAEVFNILVEFADRLADKTENPFSYDLTIDFTMEEFAKKDTIRKTYVMNESTLKQISQVSKQLNVSRDALINESAELINALLDEELYERAKKYSKYLKRIDAAVDELYKIEKEMKENLDDEDPILSNLNMMLALAEKERQKMGEYLFEGRII